MKFLTFLFLVSTRVWAISVICISWACAGEAIGSAASYDASIRQIGESYWKNKSPGSQVCVTITETGEVRVPAGQVRTKCPALRAYDTGEGRESSCFSWDGNKCTPKPGLFRGQEFVLKKDFLLPVAQPLFFADGQRVEIAALQEGQTYCQVAFATDGQHQPNLPQRLRVGNEFGRIPAGLSPYAVSEIAWYVEQIFLSTDAQGEKLQLSFYCGKVRNGQLTSAEGDMSLENFQKSFRGIFHLTSSRSN